MCSRRSTIRRTDSPCNALWSRFLQTLHRPALFGSIGGPHLVFAHCCGLEYPTEYVMEALGYSNVNTYSRFLSERHWINSTLRSDIEYATTVKQAGGTQCPRCGIGVTKLSGCEHMLCFCGFHFRSSCLCACTWNVMYVVHRKRFEKKHLDLVNNALFYHHYPFAITLSSAHL
ncbi:unnamed protein product [Peronospora belbahrii]|uniref:IBR domain-containing protein n=1 Tax=Peronospora belbahrii TaxID=622444 RepID=A0ABN8CMT8_9STRA|nr:unnamed protein product [Peronospora belbahrii]